MITIKKSGKNINLTVILTVRVCIPQAFRKPHGKKRDLGGHCLGGRRGFGRTKIIWGPFFPKCPIGNWLSSTQSYTQKILQPKFGRQFWFYVRHPTGHMFATHGLAPISFGEKGKREQCQYFVFNSPLVVRFLSTRYGSYFGSTTRFQFKDGHECLIPTW